MSTDPTRPSRDKKDTSGKAVCPGFDAGCPGGRKCPAQQKYSSSNADGSKSDDKALAVYSPNMQVATYKGTPCPQGNCPIPIVINAQADQCNSANAEVRIELYIHQISMPQCPNVQCEMDEMNTGKRNSAKPKSKGHALEEPTEPIVKSTDKNRSDTAVSEVSERNTKSEDNRSGRSSGDDDERRSSNKSVKSEDKRSTRLSVDDDERQSTNKSMKSEDNRSGRSTGDDDERRSSNKSAKSEDKRSTRLSVDEDERQSTNKSMKSEDIRSRRLSDEDDGNKSMKSENNRSVHSEVSQRRRSDTSEGPIVPLRQGSLSRSERSRSQELRVKSNRSSRTDVEAPRVDKAVNTDEHMEDFEIIADGKFINRGQQT